MLLEKILEDINRSPSVVGSLICGKDGLLIAHAVPSNIDPEVVSAMASAILGTGERSVSEIGHGDLDQVMIEGSSGKTLMRDVGDGVLVVLTQPDVNLGMIRMDLQRVSKEIKAALEM
jgi:predicted regulator of Ras-like GTPase activity (Roadblock/LC7/MglB family)